MQSALSGIGPFFAIETHDRNSEVDDGWLPLAELGGRVRAVRLALAASGGVAVQDIELRVAASVTQLGLVARLLSPAIGVAVLDAVLLDLRIDRVRWKDELGGAFPLSVEAGMPMQATSVSLAALVLDVAGGVAAMLDAVVRVPRTTLVGNVASAINAACVAVGRVESKSAGRARALGDELVSALGSGVSSAGVGPTFRRRSCCLIYRVAPGARAVCGDCVLGQAASGDLR